MKKEPLINIGAVMHFFGMLIIIEAFFMLFAVFVSFAVDSRSVKPLVLSFLITLVIGFFVRNATVKYHYDSLRRRESILVVVGTWLIISLMGVLPYLLSGSITNFTDAFFETVSGFTTTGSSILTDIEAIPKGILFWRSLTHWIGGMGIVVLLVALSPFLKVSSIYLFNNEASVVISDKVNPRMFEDARMIWIIYIVLTALEIILLHFGGMDLFESACHAFGTVATGGFSTRNASIGAFSPYIQYVITVFMFLSGANFFLYLLIINRRFKTALKNEELRLYSKIVFLAGAALTFILYFKQNMDFEAAFRDAYFQVVSTITATGFATDDYLQWPVYGWLIILGLMFIGASAGSTGGGIKVIRHLIFFKYLKNQYRKLIHPNLIATVHYNGRYIDDETLTKVTNYIILYVFVFVAASLTLSFMKIDPETSFGSVITCMGGIGPGFGLTGPASNFEMLPAAAKDVLILLMLMGRLELYTFLVIFTPSFWKL
jgi:trk system potassium uptake protein TrkH